MFAPPEELDEEFVREYLRFDDAQVVKTLCAASGSKSGEVMGALMERRLCKQVFKMDNEEVPAKLGRTVGGFALKPDEQF